MNGKLRIVSKAVVNCARCNETEDILHTSWKEATKTLRDIGWSELKKEGWICPNCARARKLELKVKNKNFRGVFIIDGKRMVKTVNGIFPVGEVKGV